MSWPKVNELNSRGVYAAPAEEPESRSLVPKYEGKPVGSARVINGNW